MITKTLKTTDGKINISIPSRLTEVTVGQMVEIMAGGLSDVDAISVLSGIHRDILYTVRNMDQFNVFTEPINSICHQILNDADNSIKNVPDFILIEGKKIKVPQTLSVEPVGAFIVARDVVAGEINNHIIKYGEDKWKDNFNPALPSVVKVLAQYFFCKWSDEPYNEFKAEAFEQKILKLFMVEVFPIAKAFFLNFPDLSIKRPSYLEEKRQQWRSALALVRLKSSGQ